MDCLSKYSGLFSSRDLASEFIFECARGSFKRTNIYRRLHYFQLRVGKFKPSMFATPQTTHLALSAEADGAKSNNATFPLAKCQILTFVRAGYLGKTYFKYYFK